MPPVVALFLTLGFIFFLFRREAREPFRSSRALWIPLTWFLICGSRFPTQWLMMIGIPVSDGSLEEGSPLDALVFFALIIGGYYILTQRRVTISSFSHHNRWLVLFLLYCFIAILWSDFPFVALKRWVKILGHPIMALIVLTESDPIEAVRRLLKRTAYVLVPLSILLIKYYPQYGRGWDPWTGIAFNSGVGHNKNELGYVCLICGLFFFWNGLYARTMKDRKSRRKELILSIGFFGLICWLLKLASSATALSTMVIGIATMLVVALPVVSRRHLGAYVIIGILVFAIAEPMFGIYAHVLKLLNRNPTLTDRTEVWSLVLPLVDNPIFGAGFESFWLGSRLDKLWTAYWWKPTQAHNGYLETYLNLGWVGIFMLTGVVIATFQKIRIDLLRRFQFARFRLGFLFAILFYNFTEASFKGVHIVWTVFYLIAIDYPRLRRPKPEVKKSAPEEEESSEPVSTGSYKQAS